MATFGERLNELRKNKKVTQVDMAKFLEVSEQHYQRMEYNKVNIPMLTLILLADYFGVSLDYLTGRTDKPKVNK